MKLFYKHVGQYVVSVSDLSNMKCIIHAQTYIIITYVSTCLQVFVWSISAIIQWLLVYIGCSRWYRVTSCPDHSPMLLFSSTHSFFTLLPFVASVEEDWMVLMWEKQSGPQGGLIDKVSIGAYYVCT